MVYCPSCGVQSEDGSLFCANCGQKLDGSSNAPSKALDTPNQPMSNQPVRPEYVNDPNYGYQNPQQSQPSYSQQQNYRGTTAHQGTNAYNQPLDYYQQPDQVSPFLYVVSFLFFPFGLVMYFANRQQKPNSAKNILIASILGILLWI